MNLATWSIHNPIPSILLFFFLTLAGIWGFNQLNIQNFPDMDYPAVLAVVEQPGASPAQFHLYQRRQSGCAPAALQFGGSVDCGQ